MFTVFLLVVLATTLVSIPSDRASDFRNAAVHERQKELVVTATTTCCGYNPMTSCPRCMCDSSCNKKKPGRRND
uniref:Superfamily conotoxin n=2 Tax=Pionoconus TaxID=1340109 RepID=D4HPC6_CONAH|nr:superfamily conotoxin [Conus achatinus]ACZ49779.1 superfamily conotoxin [Conus monachus]